MPTAIHSFICSDRSGTRQALHDYRFAFYPNVQAAGVDWDVAAPTEDLFLSRRYLALLERHASSGLHLEYAVFYQNDTPVGVALFQRAYFEGRKHLREPSAGARLGQVWRHTVLLAKRYLTHVVRGDVLVCGNLLLSGEHGFHFNERALASEQATVLLLSALEDRAIRWRADAVLVKDLLPTRFSARHQFFKRAYTEFKVQPNMVLSLPFKTFDEYLSSMTTKYRTRAKRAFKKAEGLECRPLSADEILLTLPQLRALFRSVVRRSTFHWIDLDVAYFEAIQREFPDRFWLFGWYKKQQLVGFHTAFGNGTELEAHFLGYEEAANAEHQLYLNMLYHLVRLGIEAGYKRIVFGRTALEIKSSVGAVPQTLYNYLLPRTPWLRYTSCVLMPYLIPEEQWTPRHPFKRDTTAHSFKTSGLS